MPLSACPRCKKIFSKVDTPVCAPCVPIEEEEYEKVRDVMQEVPGLAFAELAEVADVDIEIILRLVKEGRIESGSSQRGLVCGRCGASAISRIKRLCESCLNQLNLELAGEQSRTRLAAKKGFVANSAISDRKVSRGMNLTRES
jgi:hypothetical protein